MTLRSYDTRTIGRQSPLDLIGDGFGLGVLVVILHLPPLGGCGTVAPRLQGVE